MLLFSRDPEADRAFFRDVLSFRSVDAGEGWLIFQLPPAELGIHPGEEQSIHRHADQELSGCVVYLMCDDLHATIAALEKKGAKTTGIVDAGWGTTTTVRLPGGGGLGLYEPRHVMALSQG
jgi:predicted enzyme related to lactoylglutathione lyase